jgi:transcriptional regulator NrdR family protein
LRVVWTYRAVDRTIRRRRRCRHCGTETTTIERTLGEEPGGQAKRGAS